MINNKQTKELNDIISYMIDVLSKEFPTNIYTSEYLIVSILDNSKSYAYEILDNCLMTSNLEKLKSIYVKWLDDNKKNYTPKPNNNKIEFNEELHNIINNAEYERNNLKSKDISSKHILLSILNPKNHFDKIQEVFKMVGIDYNFIINKYSNSFEEENIDKEESNNKKNISKQVKRISLNNQIPYKSSINKQIVTNTTSFIDKFTINVNNLAKEGKIEPLIGRKKELEHIIKVMARRNKNNVILVGESGIGKTSIAKCIASMIVDGNVPIFLKDKEMLMLDVITLVGGTNYRGMLEERVNGLFNELKNSKKYILFIDDMNNILRSQSKEKDSDLSSWIGDILSNGNVTIIGTTSFKGYKNTIEINQTIANKLQKIIIEPNTVQETIEIIECVKHYYEEHHHVKYTHEVIKKATELAKRYITDRSLPDSAIDVIDLCGANTCLSIKEPKWVSESAKKLRDLDAKQIIALNKGDFENVSKLRKQENKLKNKLTEYKRLEETKQSDNTIELTIDDVANAISDITNIPINRLTVDEKKKMATIDETLKKSVIGQDEAINDICKIIKRNKIGLGDKNRVLGSLLLLGQTGSGKTLIAKKLAEEIFGNENNLVRIDMSEYSEKNSVAKLTGAAPRIYWL